MKSIQNLIQQINVKDDPEQKREYDTLKQLDDNLIELLNRVQNIEKKNLKYYVWCSVGEDQLVLNGAPVLWNASEATFLFKTFNYPQLGNMHSNNTSNSEVRIPRNGVYHVSTGIRFAKTAAGTYRAVIIERTRNGAAVYIASNRNGHHGAGNYSMRCSRTTYCYKDDVFRVIIAHDVGAGLGTNIVGSELSTFFSVSERMEELDPSEYGLLDPSANTRPA